MGEYHLDPSGEVGAARFDDLSDIAQAYVTAMFWSNGGDGEPGTGNESGLWFECDGEHTSDARFGDLSAEALATLVADCEALEASDAFKAFAAWRKENDDAADDSQVGHDLWLTRNGSGAGFWDRPESYYGPHQDALNNYAQALGGAWPYVGDDGKVYL